MGEKSYGNLLEIPSDIQKQIEIVDIFRPAKDVAPIVDQAIKIRKKYGIPHVIWMQKGIVNEQVANYDDLVLALQRENLLESA